MMEFANRPKVNTPRQQRQGMFCARQDVRSWANTATAARSNFRIKKAVRPGARRETRSARGDSKEN